MARLSEENQCYADPTTVDSEDWSPGPKFNKYPRNWKYNGLKSIFGSEVHCVPNSIADRTLRSSPEHVDSRDVDEMHAARKQTR